MSAGGRRIEIRGTVQGVGFRPWVYRLARRAGVTGRVRNDAAGVTIEAFGSSRALEVFCRGLRQEAPATARIRRIRSRRIPPEPVRDFAIEASRAASERRVSIPADLATCPDCEREVLDPSDRRHAYPFTNCTHCGPRFTIARDVPYDRPTTTMTRFPMCPACRREYADPEDRRFHAQPNACPACGPKLRLRDAAGHPVASRNPLQDAARALRAGSIVAVKGLGGFHLACDATSQSAVRRLRLRKRREEKPFAVMVRDLAEARRLAHLRRGEERALGGPERPIVLATGRSATGPDAPCPAVSPHNPLVGLMLPYTPLHHLLLRAVGRPLVMTSANLSDEPIAYRNQEALTRLRGIADWFLVHDREIATRCEDSVVRWIAGRPTVLRRSRGYVPRAIPVRRPFRQPVLACGAQLKNSFCLGVGDSAFLGPHVGDLDNLEAWEAFREAVAKLERFVGVVPEVIAHDLHPDYLSTRYARERAGAAAVAVQHHHAHVLSAVAEAGLSGPVLGLAWDGTGLGTDRAAWGGELLLAEPDGFERLATFRALPLAGGERAIPEVWRLAFALLCDAFEGDPPLERLPVFQRVARETRDLVQRMLERRLHCPPAHGVGRYFDAVGALGLDRTHARYEGQVALAWNVAAAARERGSYPFELQREAGALLQVDLRAGVRQLVQERLRGVPAPILSARFHETLAAAAEALVRDAAACHGRLPVVLSGGCFQNPLLVERIRARLRGSFPLVLHREVPPGDGGLALGQALAADAAASGATRPCV